MEVIENVVCWGGGGGGGAAGGVDTHALKSTTRYLVAPSGSVSSSSAVHVRHVARLAQSEWALAQQKASDCALRSTA
eukprot:scaffold13097_cov59-Phaeocystis_antarctica.AAC.3